MEITKYGTCESPVPPLSLSADRKNFCLRPVKEENYKSPEPKEPGIIEVVIKIFHVLYTTQFHFIKL